MTNNTITETAKPEVKNKATKAERELETRRQEIQLGKAERVATESTSIFDPIAYQQLKTLATDLIRGGASSADADTPEKLLVKLQAGFELGMTPIQSQNSLYIVNGRVTIWGAALIGRLRQQGWAVKFTDESADGVTITVTKFASGDEQGTEISDTFLYQDAVDSGYTQSSRGEKVGWRKGQNRKLKLRYGAASQLVKTYLPDVLNGQNIGVSEIDQDAPPMFVESTAIDADVAGKIRAAATVEELTEIVQSLPVAERKAATPIATERARELQL